MLEALTCITTEIHRAYKLMWNPSSAAEMRRRAKRCCDCCSRFLMTCRATISSAPSPSVADFYLFVMLVWADRFALDLPVPLPALRERLKSRPAVRAAMAAAGVN